MADPSGAADVDRDLFMEVCFLSSFGVGLGY
jgi:hypothetical protein